jgi:hypothetical protein
MMTLLWRELRTGEEVLQALRLRYRAYLAEPALRGFVKRHPSGIDVEKWDFDGRLYGLFAANDPARILATYRQRDPQVAGMRLLIRTSLAGHCDPQVWSEPESVGELASTDFLPEFKALVDDHKRSLSESGMVLIEAGRLAVAPELDRANRMGIARALLDCVVATGLLFRPRRAALFCCQQSHIPFYRRQYGFKLLPGSWLTENSPFEGSAACLLARMEDIPRRVRQRLYPIAAELMGAGAQAYLHVAAHGHVLGAAS